MTSAPAIVHATLHVLVGCYSIPSRNNHLEDCCFMFPGTALVDVDSGQHSNVSTRILSEEILMC